MNKKHKNQKFQQLVTTAYNLFMRFGIHRVSIEEICSEANVSKMTFYKYFRNKIELTKYLLNQIFSEQMNKYRKIMAQQVSFPEKVKQIIQLKQEQTDMMSQEFFNDLFRNPNPEIVELVEKMRQESFNEVLNDLKKARENRDIRQNLKPEFILYFLNHMTEMVKDENLLKLYNSPNELIMELTSFFFYGILTPEEYKEV
ncbi:TetR/AcrR family transcriptional regulator [candidate division KSB1 bacterium]|nr:MAG: TetR/AcrR family transcriptional regulator [candidate division KSB1 bacterium]